MGVRVGADATMTDSACVHPAVALVDEPGLGRTMRAVGSVERGALLLHESNTVVQYLATKYGPEQVLTTTKVTHPDGTTLETTTTATKSQ